MSVLRDGTRFQGDIGCQAQEDESVRLVGVEASGHGLDTEKHAATLTKGTPGVLHGSFSFLLQDSEGQVIDPHSISAGCAATPRR